KAGTGLLIAVGQLGKLLGIDQTGDHFFDKLWSALSQLDEIDWPTAAIAGASVAVLLALKRWAPKAVPAALIVVAGGIIVGAAACRRRRSTTRRARSWPAGSRACWPCSRCCSWQGCSPTCRRRRSARSWW